MYGSKGTKYLGANLYFYSVHNHSLRLLSVEDGVQEQLEVSLEHSLTQRLGKHWKLWTEREREQHQI